MSGTPLKKLPVGIQDFEKLRTGNYVYVDKTEYLVDLIDSGAPCFLSRPRRFGKSLTVSTFDALFSGRRELFEGLCAQEFLDRPGFAPSPVVRLDMSRATTNRDLDALEYSMLKQVMENAERHGVEVADPYPGDALGTLLRRTAQKHGRVVVLVDEYDKPILDALSDPERAQIFRESLRNLYTQIKADDANTRFVFVTGISKFTRTGVFSAMNNLKDISMKDEYAAMLGYTEDELVHNFAPHIARTAEKLAIPKQELLERMKSYYDGFSFDGVTRLYNPFSTLNFFGDATFDNYWFDSGSPSFLVNYVKTRDLEMEDFRGLKEEEDFTSATEIETARPSSFLFQSGYLTVREKDGPLLTLDYPNMEVLSSVARLFMTGKYQNDRGGVIGIELRKAMDGDVRGLAPAEAILEAYRRVLAAIPYDIYEREEKKQGEAFYRALLLVLLWSSQLPTRAENHKQRAGKQSAPCESLTQRAKRVGYQSGRSDVEVEYRGKAYIIGLKVAEGKSACERAAEEAIEQIRAKGYADKYGSTPITLIGLAVDRAERQVGAFYVVSTQ